MVAGTLRGLKAQLAGMLHVKGTDSVGLHQVFDRSRVWPCDAQSNLITDGRQNGTVDLNSRALLTASVAEQTHFEVSTVENPIAKIQFYCSPLDVGE